MAVTSNPASYAGEDVEVGPRTAYAAFYILVAIVAMGVAIPAAFATFG